VRNNGDWQTLYYDTVVELDPIKLLDKIEAAQKAIADRLKNAMNPINANEQQVIETPGAIFTSSRNTQRHGTLLSGCAGNRLHRCSGRCGHRNAEVIADHMRRRGEAEGQFRLNRSTQPALAIIMTSQLAHKKLLFEEGPD
jgi:hypothetical protein